MGPSGRRLFTSNPHSLIQGISSVGACWRDTVLFRNKLNLILLLSEHCKSGEFLKLMYFLYLAPYVINQHFDTRALPANELSCDIFVMASGEVIERN